MQYKAVNGNSIVEDSVKIGNNVTIYAGCYIEGNTVIDDNVIIYANNVIKDCVIGENSLICPNNFLTNSSFGKNTHINVGNFITGSKFGEDCTLTYVVSNGAVVENGVEVGPFARLRPNALVKDRAKVGNFVEVKNATVGEGSKASHLTYVGDCDIGKDCNLGCGVIFVNYNGRTKNRTTVGDNAFIGSNSNVIAPVNIANNTYICAGTTVTEDVKEGSFVIGRSRQIEKQDRAKNYLKEMK